MSHMEDKSGYQPRPVVKSVDNGAREGCTKFDALDLALRRAGVTGSDIYKQECESLGVPSDPVAQQRAAMKRSRK